MGDGPEIIPHIAPAPVAPKEKPSPKEFQFDYATHTQEVRGKLRTFGIGPTAEFLTPEGLDRPAYVGWTRKQLLGPEFADGIPPSGLPEKIGEVTIPEKLRQHGQDISALLLSFNVGYGHLRPALALQNLVEVVGGHAHSAFLGGEEDVIPPTPKTDFGGWRDLNRLLRGVGRWYRVTNLQTAYKTGMMHEPPDLSDPDPEYTGLSKRLLGLIADRKTFKEDPERAIEGVMTFLRERTKGQVFTSYLALSLFFRRSLRTLIRNTFKNDKGKEKLVIATHGSVAEGVGTITPMTRQRIGYVDANFQPDVCMFYDTYTKNPPTYTERQETVEKWGLRQGFTHGESAKNSVVLNGYVTPLSVFKRDELTQQRREALASGAPLTVIATASGNAPAQLGAFKDFMTSHLGSFMQGNLRMIVECGAEEGGGLLVYRDLQRIVEDNHLEDSVVLHISQSPQASVQFFEALSWAPVPIAQLVKASEMTRIAQALNVPLISTGALGPHELWNLAATLLDNPTSVIFSEKTGTTTATGIKDVFPNDRLVKNHPERNYVTLLTEAIDQQTAKSPEEILEMVRHYIQSGQQSVSSPDAMLTMLDDMLQRRHAEKKSPPLLRRNQKN